MLIFTKALEIADFLAIRRNSGLQLGFVPTMGALHNGHITLVEKAKRENDLVIVSIFVNPTQFNNPEDLKNYPRTPEMDHQMLESAGADVLFQPTVDEIYTHGLKEGKEIDLGNLESVMEGAHRPGHFKGVVQVVARLFDIVLPQRAYFGEKDFQQLAVLRKMTIDLGYAIEIIGCETVREKNGLAMSSRNLRLSEEEREIATQIYKAMKYVRDNWKTLGQQEALKNAIDKINSHPPLKVEYLEIADAKDLQPIVLSDKKVNARVFAAVFCGGVRLIDNMAV
ncbi:MAG: pantoate--beta-alanine ligase [Bacteroidia bacterium]|nr:pantoate--beta-alanine ligase [Bacteroidia bacterium]